MFEIFVLLAIFLNCAYLLFCVNTVLKTDTGMLHNDPVKLSLLNNPCYELINKILEISPCKPIADSLGGQFHKN